MSSVGTNKAFLSANTAVQDIFFFGTQLSPFAYKGWTTSTNFMVERKDYSPEAAPSLKGNCTVRFQHPNDMDLTGPPALVIKLPRIHVPAGASDSDTDQIRVREIGRAHV